MVNPDRKREAFSLERSARRLFVDTSALVALADKGDANHKRAVDFLGTAHHQQWYCIRPVIYEAYTRLRTRVGVGPAMHSLVLARQFHIAKIAPTEVDHVRAVARLRKYSDQELSYTDVLITIAMDQYEAYRVFTFDDDFRVFGYELHPM